MIFILLLLIGVTLGYLFGLFTLKSLEKKLTKQIISGKEVLIVVDGVGIAYKYDNGQVISQLISIKENVEDITNVDK